MIAELFLFCAVALATSLFFTYKRRIEYFKSFERRNIQGPKPDIYFGNFRELFKTPNKNDTLEKWVKKYGEVVGFFIGPKRYIVLSNLDMINQVFIKNVKSFYNRQDFALDAKYLIDSLLALKNDRWAEVRKMMTPLFSYSKVHSGTFDPEIKKCLIEFNNEIIKRMRANKLVDLKGQKSAEFDVYNLTQAFTLDVISRTSFGLEEKVYEPDNILMKSAKDYFRFASNITVELALLIPPLRGILTWANNNLSSGRLVDMIISKLKGHIKVFLMHLQNGVSSTDDRTNEVIQSNFGQEKARVLVSLMRKLADKNMTENEFIGNILLILLAGYETTANSITNAFYLLAKHQDIQAKLREEVKKNGVESTYLDFFWHESLRFYPPVTFFVTRQANADIEVNGVQFLKGDIVQAPVWLIHRNPNYWPEPEVFKPERFEPEQRKKFHPCQFLAYGLGQKACLGSNLSNYEGKLILVDVLREFKLETCKDTPDPLKFITPTVINNPSQPVVLKFIKLDEN